MNNLDLLPTKKTKSQPWARGGERGNECSVGFEALTHFWNGSFLIRGLFGVCV